MASHVALLRGINLAGRNKIAMADLREVVISLRHTGVTTYIQSGNVLFTAADADTAAADADTAAADADTAAADADTAALASSLEHAIVRAFGLKVAVVVVSREQLAQIASDNPYRDEPNPKCVHVVFLDTEPGRELLERIATAQRAAAARGSRDSITAVGRALFLHTPDGFGNSELAKALLRIAGSGASGTARNWATTTKLLALCDEK
jgi:uncharacterized protein (DUF1697 family)